MITLEWCFWTVVLEKTLESPLDNKEVQPVHPKGNQSWIFIRRTDDEAETPILWPPDAKNWLIGKDPDAGKDWRWEEKGDDRGWVGWMASLAQWTGVWVSSGNWWWTGNSGVLQSMGSQRASELNWTDWHYFTNEMFSVCLFGHLLIHLSRLLDTFKYPMPVHIPLPSLPCCLPLLLPFSLPSLPPLLSLTIVTECP